MRNRITLLAAAVPVLMLLVSVTAFLLNTRIAEGKPSIEELSPNILSAGSSLLIKGKNFGKTRESSHIYLSSVDLLSRDILSWSDREIKVQVPSNTSSGLVTVETDRGVSNPVVLVLKENVPRIGTGAYIPGLPFIETIDPSTAGSGDIITISGNNFGNRKLNSSILFSSSWSSERDTLSGDSKLVGFIQVNDEEILSWSNDEIQFYLPDFVKTGDVYIKTRQGYSNAVYFEQDLKKSGLKLTEKKTYMIHNGVNVQFSPEEGNGLINLWFFSPDETLWQRNAVILPERDFLSSESFSDASLYRIDGTGKESNISLSENTIVDVYTRSFTVDREELNKKYNRKSPLYTRYTESNDMIQSSSSRISAVARSVTRRVSNSYDEAKAIYDYVLERLTYKEDAVEILPEKVIENKAGNDEGYALLFSSLARSIGIPARPVTGILVGNDGECKTHWWAEFYLQGFGWFPVDPALADGMPAVRDLEAPADFYWGNIDNQHIAYSRGERVVPLLFPDRKNSDDSVSYPILHSIESEGTINNLQLNWSGVRITSIY